MQQAHVFKLDVVANALAIETGKEGSGASSIKTAVVIKNANVHSDSFIFFPVRNLPNRSSLAAIEKGKVDRNDIPSEALSSSIRAGRPDESKDEGNLDKARVNLRAAQSG